MVDIRDYPSPLLQAFSDKFGKHLWRDTGAKSLIFASDAFVQAVEDRNIRGLLKVGYHQEM